jgi:predicted PurR-regulated permease PerM
MPPVFSRTAFVTGAALMVLYFCLRSLHGVSDAILLGMMGGLLAVFLDLPTALLARRMPRSLAVIVVLVALGGVGYLTLSAAIPRIAHQFLAVAMAVPAGIERALEMWHGFTKSNEPAPEVPSLTMLLPHVLPVVHSTASAAGGLVLAASLGAFLCADPEGDRQMLALLVPESRREAAVALVNRVVVVLRRWMLAMVATMAVVGVLTSVGLAAASVPGALALGVLAGVAVLVPYLGSIVVGVVILGAGLSQSPRAAVLGLIAYGVIQALLGTVIAPLMAKLVVRTPPALLLIFQLILGISFGVLGVLLAQPLFSVMVVLKEDRSNDHRAPLPPSVQSV